MIRKRKRLWALFLSAALIVTQLPAVAMAENDAPEDGSIASFEELPSGVKKQTVTVGTSLSELNLPDTVTAMIYHVTEDTVISDEDESGNPPTASPSDAKIGVSGNDSGKTVTTVTTSEEEILVTWDSEPAYDGDTTGKYVFTADAGGYTLSSGSKLTQITVTVTAKTTENPTGTPPTETEPIPCAKTEGCTLEDGHEGECVMAPPANGANVKTVTGWTFVDGENLIGGELALPGVSMDNQADIDTVVSMLPTRISGSIEGAEDAETLDITGWSCPEYIQDGDDNWPLAGDYTFTAALPDGYVCVPTPTVKVTLGGISVLTINDRHTADGLIYQETGPKTVQLIDFLEAGLTETLRVPAEITSRGRTYLVTGIGNGAFQGVGGITGLDLSGADNLAQIGQHAFGGCTLTGTISIPASVSEIANSAFSYSHITGLDLSGATGLTRIGESAFSRCAGLTGTVSIPASVREIADWAFESSGATGLDLSGANSLTRIGESAFSQCAGLTGTVSIPASVSEIADSAFTYSGVTGLDLSGANSLTRIGKNAFSQCAGLTGMVSVPATVREIGSGAFIYSNITGFIAANDAVAALLRDSGVSAHLITLPGGASPSLPPVVEFTEGELKYRGTGTDTVSVVDYVSGFSGNLDIPDQIMHNGTSYRVTEIGPFAFLNNSFITGLNLSGARFLTRIGDCAFMNCSDLTGTVTIPASVTEIGTGTFINSAITGLDLSGAANLTQIGAEAFYGCESLTGAVTIPASVTEIERGAFGSTGLTGLDLSRAANLAQIGTEAFYSCKSLTGSVAIPSNVIEIGDYAFSFDAGITGLDLSGADSLTDIGINAFYGCEGLTGTVDIPAAVTQIGKDAFNKTGITQAVIRGRLRSIGSRAFPYGIPVHCGDPDTQLLVNEALMHTDIPTASWDGQSDVPPGAIVTVDRDITINGTVSIGEEAEIAIGDGMTVTVGAGGTVTLEPGAVITVKPGGTLTIDPGATLTGGGAIELELGGTLNGTPGGGIAVAYRVTVVDGNGGGMFPAGARVSVTANPAPAGLVFDRWTTADGVTFANENAARTTFTMPDKTVTVTATYKAAPVTTHTVIFDPAGGTRIGGGELTQIVSEGASATAPIITRSGYTFAGWDKDFSQILTDMTVTAQWKENGTTGGSSSNSSGRFYIEPEPQSSYTVAGGNMNQSISRSDLKKLADSGKSLTLRCDKASMTLDAAALNAILAAVPSTTGNITFTAAPADLSTFPDAAKQIGTHPVYDYTVSYKDSKGDMVKPNVNFPAGSAAITLDYALAPAEVTGSLFMVYVDGKGAVTWLDQSSYDGGKVLAEVPHFSIYGVAYKTPAPVFTDISGHWAKQDIEFVAARGLLSGTGNNLFSPDGTMTRGMFVTALGRLAGVNPDSYQNRSFTDVKADAYYAAYVEWAAQKNIAGGTGDNLFGPDAPVTREQMAVMMTNYAGQMNYSIPTPLASVTFADNDKISAWAAKEVAAMQRAGIVKGKDGNRFDPQGNATRAEVSAVLRRFVEVVIDPATASGWVKNDSGHWLYYKGGTALTGWQTIGKLRYFFNADGVMHEGWKQDESTGKWYYWTNTGAATGWREIDGKWYYFDENGVMAVNTKVDGYEVGPDGARKEN